MPDPRRTHKRPPFVDLSFAGLGWILWAAAATGTDRFDETLRRGLFYLDKAADHAATPAEAAVIGGLAASVETLIQADAEARRLLEDSVAGIADALAAEAAESLRSSEGS